MYASRWKTGCTLVLHNSTVVQVHKAMSAAFLVVEDRMVRGSTWRRISGRTRLPVRGATYVRTSSLNAESYPTHSHSHAW